MNKAVNIPNTINGKFNCNYYLAICYYEENNYKESLSHLTASIKQSSSINNKYGCNILFGICYSSIVYYIYIYIWMYYRTRKQKRLIHLKKH